MLACASPVHADVDAPSESEPAAGEASGGAGAATAPTEHVTLPAKRAYVYANLAFDLSDGAAFDRISLSPDVWYGVNDKLTLGLVHSTMGRVGFMGGVGDSLCFGDGCDVYRNVGLDVRYEVLRDPVILAVDAGVYVSAFDPFTLAVKLGVLGRYRPSPTSKLAIDFAPSVFLGVTEREPGTVTVGTSNKEQLYVPITAWYAASAKLAIALQTGVGLSFESAGDTFAVPLTLGASYQVSKRVALSAAFTLTAVVGGDAVPSGIDGRTFTIGGGYAL